MTQCGILFIISAPSGTGKTSLVNAAIEQLEDIAVSISHTTRQKRDGEIDGQHYHFIQQEAFISMVEEGSFLEHANVFGNFYGTSQEWVSEQLEQGTDIILEIDWQGASQVRKLMPNACSIFIVPPSIATLEQRLRSRGKDQEAIIQKRLAEAKNEISHVHEYDYIVINDQFSSALTVLTGIIHGERHSLKRNDWISQTLIKELLS